MAGLSDAFGRRGIVEQLVVWGMLQQLLQAGQAPFLTSLQQTVQARFPEVALDPVTAADADARGLLGEGQAQAEAAKSGLNAQRFAVIDALRQVRIPPADLAEAILRSYLTEGEAQAEAGPQGYTPAMLAVLTNLAGDAIGPQDAARALLRGIIEPHGRGAASTSYDQAIAESRLHNKWGPVLEALAHQLASPAELAEGVVRNFTTEARAQADAARQGVDAELLQLLVHLAGDAPGPQQLAEALRRGLVARGGLGPNSTSFLQGIAEGRLADKWAPVIEGLAKLWPTPVDALDAQVKGQLDAAEGTRLYELLGGDLQFHAWLLNSIGEGPTPLEAADAAARGIIPEHGTGPASTSYDQAVRESRFRNKWTDFYRQLRHYLPPPGEVITFLAHGAIDDQRAAELLHKQDLDPDILAAFLNEAETIELSDYRGLTVSSVLAMYHGHMVSADVATGILESLHVTPKAASLLIAYTDLQQVIDSINRSVQRIASLYIGRKISADTARRALAGNEIPADAVEGLLQDWQIQAQANVKLLTETQIVDAVYYDIMTPGEGIGELQAIGYTAYDAWVVLSLKAKGKLPGQPPRDVAQPAGPVIPGVT